MDNFTKTKMFNFILEVKKLYDCACLQLNSDECSYEYWDKKAAQYTTCVNLLKELHLYNEFKEYAERLSIKLD